MSATYIIPRRSTARRRPCRSRRVGLGERLQHSTIEALNKIDLLDCRQGLALEFRLWRNGAETKSVAVSAVTGEGSDQLLALIDARLAGDRELVELDVPMSDGAGLAWLYAHGEVLRRVDE